VVDVRALRFGEEHVREFLECLDRRPGFFSAMYSRIARLSRSASASPATAMTWRVRMNPPTATATANVRTASALLCLPIWFLLQFQPRNLRSDERAF